MKKKIIIILTIVLSFIFLSSMAKIPAEAQTIEASPEPCIDRVAYYKENPEELMSRVQPITDAKWLATVADSVAPDADNTCKLAVMQCIINRTKYSGFPNSIESVCSQKNQWQGYTVTSTYSDSTYKLARELVDSIGEFRITPIETNMVYLRVGESGLYFRASWNETTEQYIPYYSLKGDKL